MSAAEARQVLRTLLRAIDRNITGITGNKQWREFARLEFRRGTALADAAERQAVLQVAKDYAFLITSVRYHKVRPIPRRRAGHDAVSAAQQYLPSPCAACRPRLPVTASLPASPHLQLPALAACLQELLLSYNIGISSDHREKGMNVRAANMVGLQMPALEESFAEHQTRTTTPQGEAA